MRIMLALFATLFISFHAHPLAAAGADAACGSPSAKAFYKAVQGLLTRSRKHGKDPEEFWSKDATFRKWVANPKSILPAVEGYLQCHPSEVADEVQVMTVPLQCLDLATYLDYVRRLTQAPKSTGYEFALHYAVAPGARWTNLLALHHDDADVKSVLQEVMRAPNVTPALQMMVSVVQGGGSQMGAASSTVKPLLLCQEPRGK